MLSELLYISDMETLASYGETPPYADPEAETCKRALEAQTASDAMKVAGDRVAKLRTSRRATHETLMQKRSEARDKELQAWEGYLIGEGTPDHEQLAEESAERTRTISWLVATLAYCDGTLMPQQILMHLRSEAILLRAMGNLLSAHAIEAARARHVAALELLRVDGAAHVTGAGRAHEFFTQALDYHRQAGVAEERVAKQEEQIALRNTLEQQQ